MAKCVILWEQVPCVCAPLIVPSSEAVDDLFGQLASALMSRSADVSGFEEVEEEEDEDEDWSEGSWESSSSESDNEEEEGVSEEIELDKQVVCVCACACVCVCVCACGLHACVYFVYSGTLLCGHLSFCPVYYVATCPYLRGYLCNGLVSIRTMESVLCIVDAHLRGVGFRCI